MKQLGGSEQNIATKADAELPTEVLPKNGFRLVVGTCVPKSLKEETVVIGPPRLKLIQGGGNLEVDAPFELKWLGVGSQPENLSQISEIARVFKSAEGHYLKRRPFSIKRYPLQTFDEVRVEREMSKRELVLLLCKWLGEGDWLDESWGGLLKLRDVIRNFENVSNYFRVRRWMNELGNIRHWRIEALD